jgi:hypothetical protein
MVAGVDVFGAFGGMVSNLWCVLSGERRVGAATTTVMLMQRRALFELVLSGAPLLVVADSPAETARAVLALVRAAAQRPKVAFHVLRRCL